MAIESAAGAGSGANADIWIYEWDRDVLTPLTRDPAIDVSPVWTPDSRRIAFGSTRGNGIANLYWQRADGAGDAQRLTDSPIPQLPDSWHPSGRFLAFHEGNPAMNQQRLMVLPIEGDEATGWKPGQPTELVGGRALKSFPIFSPDGRWVSYSSNESGRNQVYVQPFPGPGGKVQISGGGGTQTMWSHTRPELFYSTGGEVLQIMVVPYTVVGGTFRAEKPRLWSKAGIAMSQMSINYGWHFDLHPDGQRFSVAPLSTAPAAPPKLDEIVFVFNFADYLRKIAPGTR
jgi:eukaryotic-like serine/threonine-protein kinase